MNTSKKILTEKTIQAHVEHICQQGCSIVRQYIEVLEENSNSQVSHAQHISDSCPDLLKQTTETQQQQILEELKSIMAVYDNKNCDGN